LSIDPIAYRTIPPCQPEPQQATNPELRIPLVAPPSVRQAP
jgi:hypothetical protein